VYEDILNRRKMVASAEGSSPLVTVLITAFNRRDDLRVTLESLSQQSWKKLEFIVIDDSSQPSLEPVVRTARPDAVFIRNDRNQGYIASRSIGMRVATGRYIITLDDDSNLTAPDDISNAVKLMECRPDVGIVAFTQIQGAAFPEIVDRSQPVRYSAGYFGCGNMMRTSMVRQLGGYRDWFFYYVEEAEYSLRALQAGWLILSVPGIVVHHRVSPVGRQAAKIFKYSFRNSLHVIVLYLPMPRLLIEFGWKVLVFCGIAIRHFWIGPFIWALASFVAGLGHTLSLRTPLTRGQLRIYDASRSQSVTDIANPVTKSLFWIMVRSKLKPKQKIRALQEKRP